MSCDVAHGTIEVKKYNVSTGPYTTARLTELMHIAPLMNLYSEEGGSVKYETLLDKRGELLLKLLIDVRTGGEEA